jgi:hydrogenase maturation protein HypF
MRAFELCPACRAEYSDPADRRYHAQPLACPACGPHMEPDGWEVLWKESMEQGRIVAVKGVGGFHLACDARNDKAVSGLRSRKGRENKPFALMVPDLKWVKTVCEVSPLEERLLLSRERPIVLLKRKQDISGFEKIAPGLDTLGVMLPYSPMHQIMFDLFPNPVVMTSANYSSEPMIHTNENAREKLGDVADVFLLHNRAILNRADDSVCAVSAGQTVVIRAGRGVAPCSMPVDTDRCILAFGADMKNTFALAHHGQLTLSPYIGDLAHPETQQILERAVQQQLDCFQVKPDLIVHDLHPDYFSTRMARQLASRFNIPALAVQHHHAHLVSAHSGKAIGFAFDGTGYGTDESIWGGEVMLYDTGGFSREYHLRPFALPGGDAAVKNPRRVLEALLHQACPERLEDSVVRTQLEAGINCPVTTGMGRLFDAVSCLLGVCESPTYDGEAAMRLEAAADAKECGDLEFNIHGGEIDWRSLILDLIDEQERGVAVPVLAARFHNTLAEIIYCCGRDLSAKHGRLPWVFAGGVFQNRLLADRIRSVAGDEYELTFSSYPNDSGIAVGQINVGAKQWASK